MVLGLSLLVLPAGLIASPVRNFEFDSYQDYLKGKSTNVSIDSEGKLSLSNAVVEAGAMPESSIWCLAIDSAGNVYAGTGYDGRVIKITPDGKSSTFFDSEETHATALAIDASGTVYAATSPNGKIYSIGQGGRSEVYAKTEDKYVWAMVFDSAGNLYAGTGDRGIVRKISRAKEASTFFSSGDGNIVCLAIDSAGNLLAGGDTQGAVYRISPAGKALAIWSSDLREIRSVIPRSDGSIIIAAAEGKREGEPLMPARPPSTPAAGIGGGTPEITTTVESESVAGITISTSPLPRPPTEKKARGLVVQLFPDGTAKEIWRSEEDTVYSLLETGAGRLMVATGNRGRLYWVDRDGRSGLAAEFDGEQCTAIARFGQDRIICAVNNRPGVYRLSGAPASQGTFVSNVLDAGGMASWGEIRWIARGSGINITTRSGNTPQPDATWSDWSAPMKNPAGDHIQSPSSRYVQWKASFTPGSGADETELDATTIDYRQKNAPPRIVSITVAPPGEVYQKSFSTGEGEYLGGEALNQRARQKPDLGGAQSLSGLQAGMASGKKLYASGLQTFLWTAADPNDDTLVYSISFRQIEEKSWRSIKVDADQTALVIDTTSLPDGTYRIKVEASDKPDNPKSEALTASEESDTFVVDNSPPRIAAPVASGGAWLFTVSDGASPITTLEISVNAGPWQPVFPKDGICDGLQEQVETPKPQPGQLMVLKATDLRGNYVVQKIGP